MSRADMANPDFSGYLWKRSMWLKDWRSRYFVLKGSMLYFSKTPSDAPHGIVDLKDCITVKSAEDTTRKAHSFELQTPETTYYMYAASDKDKDDWIGAMGRAIVRYSNAYTREDGVED
jgi:hypothetical protein